MLFTKRKFQEERRKLIKIMDGKKQEMKLFKTNYFSNAKLLKGESRMLKKLQVKE